MTYHVAPTGNDRNPGTDPTRAVRSITRAIDLILDLPGEPAETIEVAAGVYANEHGEVFPLIVPHNIEIRGEGRDSTVLEYDLDSAVDDYVDLRGSLYDMAIRARGSITCANDLRSTDQRAVAQRIAGHTLDFEWARHIVEVEFDYWIGVGEGFESGGDLYPLVEDCAPSSYEQSNARFVVRGGRVERCLSSYFWIVSPGHTMFQNNRIGNCLGGVSDAFIVVRGREEPPEEGEPIPQILNNSIAEDLIYVTGDIGALFTFPTIWVCGESIWRGNTMQSLEFTVASSAIFEDNPLIAAGQFDIRRAGNYWQFPDTSEPMREIAPVFRNNTFRQIRFQNMYSCDWLADEDPLCWRPPTLLWIGDDAMPVLEGNVFNTLVGIAYIDAEAVPDFGNGRSGGGNVFQRQDESFCPVYYPAFIVDIGEGRSLDLNARNNTWWQSTVRVEVRSGRVTCHTDPTPHTVEEV